MLFINYPVVPWPRPILHGLVASSSLPKYYNDMVCPFKVAPGRACLSCLKNDEFVKSRKTPFFVILANPGP